MNDVNRGGINFLFFFPPSATDGGVEIGQEIFSLICRPYKMRKIRGQYNLYVFE